MTAEQRPGAGTPRMHSDRAVLCAKGCPRHCHLRHDHYQPLPGVLAPPPHTDTAWMMPLGLGLGCLGGGDGVTLDAAAAAL